MRSNLFFVSHRNRLSTEEVVAENVDSPLLQEGGASQLLMAMMMMRWLQDRGRSFRQGRDRVRMEDQVPPGR